MAASEGGPVRITTMPSQQFHTFELSDFTLDTEALGATLDEAKATETLQVRMPTWRVETV